MREFDPVRVGEAECGSWVAYYRREWARFLRCALVLVRAGFTLSWRQTLWGAWLVLRANQVWAPAANDPARAQELMRRFYAMVARAHPDEVFDVAEAARLEVDWWRAHRENQHDRGGTEADLVEALTRLYAHVYRTPADAVRPAAQLRADAMRISDRWVADGCDPVSPALPVERRALVESYTALRAAVQPLG